MLHIYISQEVLIFCIYIYLLINMKFDYFRKNVTHQLLMVKYIRRVVLNKFPNTNIIVETIKI